MSPSIVDIAICLFLLILALYPVGLTIFMLLDHRHRRNKDT